MSVQGKLKMKRQDLEEFRGRGSWGLDNENSMVKFMKVTRLFHSVWGTVSGHFPQSGRWCRGGPGPQGSVGRAPQGWSDYQRDMATSRGGFFVVVAVSAVPLSLQDLSSLTRD